METKLERYINYVVGDLVKNTEIDYKQETIKYPHYHYSSPLPYLSFFPFSLYSSSSKYIRERYGAREEEMKIIWDLYKERIKKLIDNE